MTRRSAPVGGPSHKPAAKLKLTSESTAPPPNPDYDDDAPELEGHASDNLTEAEWRAVFAREARDLALLEVAP